MELPEQIIGRGEFALGTGVVVFDEAVVVIVVEHPDTVFVITTVYVPGWSTIAVEFVDPDTTFGPVQEKSAVDKVVLAVADIVVTIQDNAPLVLTVADGTPALANTWTLELF